MLANSHEITANGRQQIADPIKHANKRCKNKHTTDTYPVRESQTMTMLFGPMSAVTTQRR